MISDVLRFALIAVLGAVSATATGAEFLVDCPISLAADAVAVTRPPPGWTPFTPTFLPLHAVGITDGSASRKAVLKPDSIVTRKNMETLKWDLRNVADVWLSCDYGEGNEVILSKALPPGTSECTVTYTKGAPGEFDKIGVRCKSGH
jgi:hypothetical protein